MMTPKQLRQALGDIGRAVSARQLTDWRAKGLLSPLKQVGQGRGSGARYFWGEADVLDRAATVYDALALRSRVQPTLLTIWFAGYPVPISLIRKAWLGQIRGEERQIRRIATKLGGLENVYGKLATTAAKRQSSKLRVSFQDLEEIMVEIFGSALDKNYEFDPEMYRDLFSKAFSALVSKDVLFTPSLNARTLSKLQLWLKDLATTKGRREILSSASDLDLLNAHAKWLILGKAMQLVPGVDRLVGGVGLNAPKQVSRSFGGAIILILLYISRSRYATRVTKIFELGNDLIVSHELDIHRALEQQQSFNVDYPVLGAKLEFLKEKISELWELFWTDLSNGSDEHIC
jgi:hypothetical protein